MKKIKIIVLAFIYVLSILLYIGCSNEKTLEIVNWNNESASATLGEIYKLPNYVAKDKNGLEYQVAITVKDSKGNIVDYINFEFIVADKNGYTANYVVTHAEKEYIKSLSINIEDKSAPQISLGSISTYYLIGDIIDLTTINALDDSGEVITPTINLFKLANNKKQKIEFELEFALQECGEYLIEVEAKDTNNNISKREHKFYVAPEGELNSFYDVSSISNFGIPGGKSVMTYMEEFSGRKGVIKLSYGNLIDGWANFSIKPTQSQENYEKYDYLVFRIFIEDINDTLSSIWMGTGINDKQYKIDITSKNMWVDYIVPMEKFINLYQEMVDMQWAGGKYSVNTSNKEFNLYIDNVFAANAETITNNSELNTFAKGEEIEFDLSTSNLEKANYTIDIVTPKLETIYNLTNKLVLDQIGIYKVNVNLNETHRTASLTYNIEVKGNYYFKSESVIPVFYSSELNVIPQYKAYKQLDNEEVADAVISYKIIDSLGKEITINNRTFNAPKGNYTLSISYVNNDEELLELVKFSIISTFKGEFRSFDNSEDFADNVAIKTNTKGWERIELAEFKGRAGVIKLPNENNVWPSFGFKPLLPVSEYQGFEYLVIRMYIEDPSSSIKYWQFPGKDSSSLGTIRKGEWFDYSVPMSKLIDNYDTINELYFWGEALETGAYNIYIDSIFGANKADLVNSTSTTSVQKGEFKINVSATNIENAKILYDITKSDGTLFSTYSPSFIVDKIGKYKVTAHLMEMGKVGTVSFEFEVEGLYYLKSSTKITHYVKDVTGTLPEFKLLKKSDNSEVESKITYNLYNLSGELVVLEENNSFNLKEGEYTLKVKAIIDDDEYLTIIKIVVLKTDSILEDSIYWINTGNNTTESNYNQEFINNGTTSVKVVTQTAWQRTSLIIENNMGLEEGKKYKFTCMIYSLEDMWTWIGVNDQGTAGSGYNTISPKAGIWTEYTQEITANSNFILRIQAGEAACTWYLDNFKIEELA